MSVAQARVARCCYEPDPMCRATSYNSFTNCNLHRARAGHEEISAIACYLSLSGNEWGAGTECCYDTEGQLITRGTGAGTDDRHRPSSLPVAHFFDDTLPYLACCLLTANDESCTTYFNLRPLRRGSNSRSVWGGTWGDPHYTTLDGSAFTFNGYGEYTYLAIASSAPAPDSFNSSSQNYSFIAQVRTTPVFYSNQTIATLATVTRGLAAKSDHPQAESISVTVSRRELLIVRRGNETIDLDTVSADTVSTRDSFVLFYPEMTLERNRTSGALTLSWFIGVSIQITPIILSSPVAGTVVLNLGVSVAGSFQGRTYGLLGFYDNNRTNDLRTPNGSVVDNADSLTEAQIYYEFGQTWVINPKQSLFFL
ncbi:unnamed protein product [Rotaria sp. Silwood1]|nr:unnamed protein product [Rotaria sp. Silwood1]CAF1597384.1 unnamed protein product [Rotaria sp. Silwood1]